MRRESLIFDLGFHNGTDTKNYLSKKYQVVAVEANPELIKYGWSEFKNNINYEELVLLNNAIVSESYEGTSIDFYINKNHTDWSSCIKEIAEQDKQSSMLVSVPVITLKQLIFTYGIPYYLKVDVEGMDIEVAKQLTELEEKPEYVSFELNKKDFADIFTYLYMAGYGQFQLVNQANNEPYSSGEFGKYLPEDNWKSYAETLADYVKYRELKFIDNKNLALGWIDIHARML